MVGKAPHLHLHDNSHRKDEVFAAPDQNVGDFAFNATVAAVFDDMVTRSVPYYGEIQRMVCELAKDFADREGAGLLIASPAPGMSQGFEAEVRL